MQYGFGKDPSKGMLVLRLGLNAFGKYLTEEFEEIIGSGTPVWQTVIAQFSPYSLDVAHPAVP